MTNLSLKRRLSDWLHGNRAAKLHYQAVENPSNDDVEAVRRGLIEYNSRFASPMTQSPLGAFARDPTGRIRGGACGYVAWGWLHTEHLWVEEPLRGKGVGSRLMAQLERAALSKGVYRFQLSTTSFQALAFFQRNGYEVYATLDDYPPGFVSYSLRKIIDLTGGSR